MPDIKLTGEYSADVNMLSDEVKRLRIYESRWLYLKRKFCLTGNGDGTCSMYAINLPLRINGWPDPEHVTEFCEKAIDYAASEEVRT